MTEYNLNEGNNLISYTCPHSGAVEELIVDDCIEGILGQGVASYNINGIGWIGSLESFESGKGYWFKSNSSMCFNYACAE